MTIKNLFTILIFAISFSAYAEKKTDALIVFGEDFAFSVKEPHGWQCLCSGEEPALFGANAVFIRKGETLNSAAAIIRVRLNNKTDERIEEDMKADVEQYRAKYPGINFKDIKVDHKMAKVIAKIFFIKNSFFEYVAYINPGPGVSKMFSGSMNVSKREATNSEFLAYQDIVSSLALISEKDKNSKPLGKPIKTSK